MKWYTGLWVLAPVLASAETITPLFQPAAISIPSRTNIEAQVPSVTATPISPIYNSTNVLDPIFSAASYMLSEVNDHFHLDLRKRQGGVPIAAPAATTVPTQLSPVTTYSKNGVAGVYTQTFAAVPDQWPSASAGSVGLGTISGQVGVVKTKSKRSAPAQATQESSQVVRIRGREVTLS